MNKKAEQPVTVKPDLPAIPGYRKSTTYPIEVTGLYEFLTAYAKAIVKKDHTRAAFLRRFITLSEKELRDYARDLKDPERFMREIPGVRCSKE